MKNLFIKIEEPNWKENDILVWKKKVTIFLHERMSDLKWAFAQEIYYHMVSLVLITSFWCYILNFGTKFDHFQKWRNFNFYKTGQFVQIMICYSTYLITASLQGIWIKKIIKKQIHCKTIAYLYFRCLFYIIILFF